MSKKFILSLVAITGLVIAPFTPAMQVAAADGTEYGFTVSLDVSPPMTAPEYEAALDTYKNDVDTMAAHQQKWIRLGIPAWVVAWWDTDHLEAGTTDDALELETIDYYSRAIDYARQADMKVYIVLTEGIAQDNSYSQAEYTEHMEDYWNFIAAHVGDKVDVIQIYNEAQEYHYRFYTDVDEVDRPAYWAGMKTMFDIAGGIFKAANPDVLITANSFGYPANDAAEQNYFEFYDAVAESLDVIALDLYPESQDDIDHLPDRITNAETRYNKPVIVSEIGRHGMIDAGGDGSRTIDGQRQNVVKYMDALRSTSAMATIVYGLRDNGPDDTEWEANFGIMEYNGDHKDSFDDIMYSMRPNVEDPDAGDGDTNGNNDGGSGSGSDIIIPKVPNTGTAQ